MYTDSTPPQLYILLFWFCFQEECISFSFLYRFSYASLHAISTDYEFLINFDWFQLHVLLYLVIYNYLDLAFLKILLRILKKKLVLSFIDYKFFQSNYQMAESQNEQLLE